MSDVEKEPIENGAVEYTVTLNTPKIDKAIEDLRLNSILLFSSTDSRVADALEEIKKILNEIVRTKK